MKLTKLFVPPRGPTPLGFKYHNRSILADFHLGLQLDIGFLKVNLHLTLRSRHMLPFSQSWRIRFITLTTPKSPGVWFDD